MKKRTKKVKVVRDIYQTCDAVCKIQCEIGDLKRKIADLLPKLEQAMKVHQENLQATATTKGADAQMAAVILENHYSDDAIALALRHAAGGVEHLLEVVELELPAEEVA